MIFVKKYTCQIVQATALALDRFSTSESKSFGYTMIIHLDTKQRIVQMYKACTCAHEYVGLLTCTITSFLWA